jgi:hypothetical protein
MAAGGYWFIFNYEKQMQQNITALEAELNAQKEQLQQDGIFSQSKLDQLIKQAKDFHPRKKLFQFAYVRLAIVELVEKLSQGWRFENDNYAVIHHGGSSVGLHLIKPVEIYEAELNDLAAETEANYRAFVEAAKAKLIPQIAKLQIELKTAQDAIKKQTDAERKLQNEMQKQIAELEADLIAATTAEASNG